MEVGGVRDGVGESLTMPLLVALSIKARWGWGWPDAPQTGVQVLLREYLLRERELEGTLLKNNGVGCEWEKKIWCAMDGWNTSPHARHLQVCILND